MPPGHFPNYPAGWFSRLFPWILKLIFHSDIVAEQNVVKVHYPRYLGCCRICLFVIRHYLNRARLYDNTERSLRTDDLAEISPTSHYYVADKTHYIEQWLRITILDPSEAIHRESLLSVAINMLEDGPAWRYL